VISLKRVIIYFAVLYIFSFLGIFLLFQTPKYGFLSSYLFLKYAHSFQITSTYDWDIKKIEENPTYKKYSDILKQSSFSSLRKVQQDKKMEEIQFSFLAKHGILDVEVMFPFIIDKEKKRIFHQGDALSRFFKKKEWEGKVLSFPYSSSEDELGTFIRELKRDSFSKISRNSYELFLKKKEAQKMLSLLFGEQAEKFPFESVKISIEKHHFMIKEETIRILVENGDQVVIHSSYHDYNKPFEFEFTPNEYDVIEFPVEND